MEEKEYIGLWSKLHNLDNLILTLSKWLDDAAKHHMKMLTYSENINHFKVMGYPNPTRHFPI